MPNPTASISSQHPEAVEAASRAMSAHANPSYVFVGNANLDHQIQYTVKIFNVSDVEVRIERPWVNFNASQRGKFVIVPAKREGERYSKPFVIADIVQIPIRNDSNKTVSTYGQRAEFLAQDALNPDDMQGSWKTVRPLNAGNSINQDVNLYHWGLFWTRNDVPTDEEIATAETRLEANYNRLIDEAKMLWASDKKREIGTTHRRAASYFGLEFEWNVLYTTQKECPGCGTKISPKAVICPKCPATFNWTEALSLGLRSKQQAIDAGVYEPQAEAVAAKTRPARAKKT